MHVVEESSTNEGYLVNDQQDDDFPLLLEARTARLSPGEGGGTCKRNNGADIPLGLLEMQ